MNLNYRNEYKTAPCVICEDPNGMAGTGRCHRCYELEKIILKDFYLAEKIIQVTYKRGSILKVKDKWKSNKKP